MKKIIIIDGNSLINRAYYALQRPMITKSGLYTQGVYGFLNMLNKINQDYQPDYMAASEETIVKFLLDPLEEASSSSKASAACKDSPPSAVSSTVCPLSDDP